VKRCIRCAAVFEDPSWRCPQCGFEPRQAGEITCFAEPSGDEGFDAEAFDRLAALEPGSFWFESRNRLITWALARYFPDARDVLELGCGTGFVLEHLARTRPEIRLSGAEFHAGGLVHAQRRVPAAQFYQLDARALPFSGAFDVVGLFDVLEHIHEDDAVLAGVREALRPGGGLILSVPQHPWLWSSIDEYARHERRYRRGELVAKAEAAGFAVQRVTSFVTFLLPVMALSRMWERCRARPPEPSREHLAAQRAAGTLGRMLGVERSLIARGIDLPAGGSLLLVATRS
jgi:SAM-dependent methyltransferase